MNPELLSLAAFRAELMDEGAFGLASDTHQRQGRSTDSGE